MPGSAAKGGRGEHSYQLGRSSLRSSKAPTSAPRPATSQPILEDIAEQVVQTQRFAVFVERGDEQAAAPDLGERLRGVAGAADRGALRAAKLGQHRAAQQEVTQPLRHLGGNLAGQ
jgi:hypothetical protein